MRLGTKHFHAGRLAAGVGLMLAGAMLTGCMSADRRSNTTNQPKVTKTNTNNNQSNSGNSGSASGAGNVAANQNSNSSNTAANTAGQNANANSSANNGLPANGTPGMAPLGRPTGWNNAPNNSIPGSNMNNPPQFGGGIQPTGAMVPANANGLQPIASSVNTPNRGSPAIQPLNGPAAGPGGMPPLDAVPSGNSNTVITSQRPMPPAVSTQSFDKTLSFPQNGPLLPGPNVNPGPARTTPASAGTINPAPLGPINPAPATSNLTPLGNGPLNLAPAGNGPINPAPVNTIPNAGIAPLPPGGN